MLIGPPLCVLGHVLVRGALSAFAFNRYAI